MLKFTADGMAGTRDQRAVFGNGAIAGTGGNSSRIQARRHQRQKASKLGLGLCPVVIP